MSTIEIPTTENVEVAVVAAALNLVLKANVGQQSPSVESLSDDFIKVYSKIRKVVKNHGIDYSEI